MWSTAALAVALVIKWADAIHRPVASVDGGRRKWSPRWVKGTAAVIQRSVASEGACGPGHVHGDLKSRLGGLEGFFPVQIKLRTGVNDGYINLGEEVLGRGSARRLGRTALCVYW